MTRATDLDRLSGLRTALLFAFLTLVARLWYLQLVRGKDLEREAVTNRVRTIALPAPRGMIHDRRGICLATSRSTYDAVVVPSDLPADPERQAIVVNRLSGIVGMPPEEIVKILRAKGTRPFDPVTIKPSVSLKTLTLLSENAVFLPGVGVRTSLKRYYRGGKLAAHLLGHIGEISDAELQQVLVANHALARRAGLRAGDEWGKGGAERRYNPYLLGRKGKERVEVNAVGQLVRRLGVTRCQPGANVVLTLDANLQKVAESALAKTGRAGAVVVLDVLSAEVVALASSPSFDPNLFSGCLSKRQWEAMASDPGKPQLNRALGGVYPPGSTFKLVTAVAGLETGVIKPSTRFYCAGVYEVGRKFRCWKRSGHGSLDLYQALARSCDVYFYHVGQRLGVERLASWARKLGLGARTGIDLGGERSGTIPTDAWKLKRFGEKWYTGDTLNMSIGQGFVEATPLQMACLTVAVANGGTWYPPQIVRQIIASNGQVLRADRPEGRKCVPKAEALQTVRRGMVEAVWGEEGTARVLQTGEVRVAGKTGSAEDARHPLPHAWFLSFAPADHPRLACAVVVENAGHGATEAAPVAKAIFQAAFRRAEETGSTSATRLAAVPNSGNGSTQEPKGPFDPGGP